MRSRGVPQLLLAALLAGCSTFGARTPGDKVDPWENWNRKVFNFNEDLVNWLDVSKNPLVPDAFKAFVDKWGDWLTVGAFGLLGVILLAIGARKGRLPEDDTGGVAPRDTDV